MSNKIVSRISIILSSKMLENIEAFQRENKIPTRTEAIRVLFKLALDKSKNWITTRL